MITFYGFILSYFLQHFAMGYLLYRLLTKKQKGWISIDSIICIVISSILRLAIFAVGTRSIFSFYNIDSIIGIGLSSAILYCAINKNDFLDMPSITLPICYKWYVLMGVALIFAIIFPPSISAGYIFNVVTGFFFYLEAIALVPQIYLIKKEGNIGGFTSLYISLIGLSRILRLLFWIFIMFIGLPFFSLIIADSLHTFLVGQLMYEYVKILKTTNLLPFTEKGHIS